VAARRWRKVDVGVGWTAVADQKRWAELTGRTEGRQWSAVELDQGNRKIDLGKHPSFAVERKDWTLAVDGSCSTSGCAKMRNALEISEINSGLLATRRIEHGRLIFLDRCKEVCHSLSSFRFGCRTGSLSR
jgi:hypothetical protein